MPRELRISVLGNVDSGKSSLTGVLMRNVLDDGRGYARSLVSQFNHERITGKTSSVTQNYLEEEGRVTVYIDLAGHEKYLKTTLHGMTGFYPDYGMVVVGANMGITDITREHMQVAISLNMPLMIVITKIDIAPRHVFERTKEAVVRLVEGKMRGMGKSIVWMRDEEQVASMTTPRKHVPIFCVSNKTGEGIGLLRQYIDYLHNFYETHEISALNSLDDMEGFDIFSMDRAYQVNGVGMVISGKVCKGELRRGDTLWFGPFHGLWVEVAVRSFHDNFRNPKENLAEGESGCVAVKCITKNVDLKKMKFRKGMYLMNTDLCKKYTHQTFLADVFILQSHSTTISRNYQPVIHCNKIVQSACIEEILEIHRGVEAPPESANYMRAGDRCRVRFSFMHRPEFLHVGDRFLFREGQTRGIGVIRGV
jgi:GTPase